MSKKTPPTPNNRAALAQNFLVNPQTVRQLVQQAALQKEDLVLEIGPGEGIITHELATRCGRVQAIELDRRLHLALQQQLAPFDNVTIEQGDFLNRPLPREPYKIFSNIPFNITADILLKLWQERHPPRDSFFIMQREAAEKFVLSRPTAESAVLFQPWFEFEILASISRFEFRPVPSVDAVLLRMTPKGQPLLSPKEKPPFYQFVTYGYRRWKKNLKIGYKDIFTYTQWKRLSRDLGFPIEALPTQLTLEQWLAVYGYFKAGVTDEKKRPVEQFRPS